jgi:hypothetical protein
MQKSQVNAYEKEIRLSGGLASMGKTVPSYRMALESEIGRWQRPHMALDGKTPAEACGITIEGKNKWKTLIENANQQKK